MSACAVAATGEPDGVSDELSFLEQEISINTAHNTVGREATWRKVNCFDFMILMV